MINATHGAGKQYAQALPANPPAQAGKNAGPPTSGQTGQPARPGARRPNGPHPLQQQATGQAGAPGQAAPLVGPRTTVLDTVDWNSRANLVGIEHHLVLGHEQRSGDARLGNAQVASTPAIRLDLHTDGTMPAAALQHAEWLGKQAAFTVLNNTMAQFRLQGTAAGATLHNISAWLAQPGVRMTASVLADTMKAASEAVHAHKSQQLGASRAERKVGRMPMDCVTHLGHAIRRARQGADPGQRALLRQLDAQAKARVLQHRLTFADTRGWLLQVQADCRRQGLDGLGTLAGQLHGAIPDPATATAHHAQLHDNLYGRALESALVDELVRDPPARVRHGMDAMAAHLAETLSALPAAQQHDTALAVQGWLRHGRRTWQGASPTLEAFFQAPPQAALARLHELLRAPAANGADCLAIPFLAVKMSVCLDQRHAAPWMAAANANYGGVVHHAASRISETVPNPNRASASAGITTHHQPGIRPSHEFALHPADSNRPNLAAASPELQLALQHGVPFVSGVSGSTNIVLHMVDAMRRQGKPVDARDALLGTMMFLTHDGGHSMHEVMWIGNQLDGALGLGIGMPGGERSAFVADYQRFIAAFPPDGAGKALSAAADRAWDATLDHFGRHSHFSPDNPPA